MNSEKLFELIKNTELYYYSFCASIDSLGISTLIAKRDNRIGSRLYNLFSGFHVGIENFPIGNRYKVCLAGDSIFVVRDISIDEESQNKLQNIYEEFCGHIFAISSEIQLIEETTFDSKKRKYPGIRVIISYGKTYEIYKNDLWQKYDNCFVLTGANTALTKCLLADKAGHRRGFLWNYVFYEQFGKEYTYKGHKIKTIHPSNQSKKKPELYHNIFKAINERSMKKAKIKKIF